MSLSESTPVCRQKAGRGGSRPFGRISSKVVHIAKVVPYARLIYLWTGKVEDITDDLLIIEDCGYAEIVAFA
jgi:hypothetical protein